MGSDASARLYVLAAAVLFSTGGAAIKISALSSWQIAGFRSLVAALVLWLAVPAWRHVGFPTLAVGAAYAATMILYVTANTLTTAANAIFLQSAAPLYVLLLAPFLLGERNRLADLSVVTLIGAGLALVFWSSDPPLATAPNPARGNGLAVASGVSWALTLIGLRWLGTRKAPPGRDPTGAAVLAGNVLAFAVCAPFAFPVAAPAPTDLAVVAYLGVFQIGLAYLCLVRGVQRVRALEVALLLVLEPVLNALWAWLVHAELPGTLAMTGCGLILAGVLAQALIRPPPPEAGVP